MKKYLFLVYALLFTVFCHGQTSVIRENIKVENQAAIIGSMSVGGMSVDPSSIIDVVSTDKGILIPRLSTGQRDAISGPATGLLIFNTTTGEFNFYDGASWESIAGGGANALNELTDVTLTGVAQGDLMYRNATEWVNLGPGTSGQVLTTNGAAANPTWESITGSGGIYSGDGNVGQGTEATSDRTTLSGFILTDGGTVSPASPNKTALFNIKVDKQTTFYEPLNIEAQSPAVGDVNSIRWTGGNTNNNVYGQIGIEYKNVTDGTESAVMTFKANDGTVSGRTIEGTEAMVLVSGNQLGINVNPTSANPVSVSASLELNDVTRGLLANRWTTTQRNAISTPASGLMGYNTTTGSYQFYNGAVWSDIGGGGDSGNILDTDGLTLTTSKSHTITNGQTLTFENSDGSPLSIMSINGVAANNRNVTVNGYLAVNTTGTNAGLRVRPNASGQLYSFLSESFAGSTMIEAINTSGELLRLGNTSGVEVAVGSVSTPSAKLHVKGINDLSTSDAFLVENSSGTDLMMIQNDGKIGIGTDAPLFTLQLQSSSTDDGIYMREGATQQAFYGWDATGSLIQLMSETGAIESEYQNGAWSLGGTHGAVALLDSRGGSGELGLYVESGGVGNALVVDANGSIVSGAASASASAKLDIVSTTKGVLFPRMTATQASAITPVNGLVLYTTDTNGTFTQIGLWCYVNGTWTALH